MNHWYVRLKLPALLVTAAAGAVAAAGWLVLGQHMDGSANDPVSDGFIWLSQRLFGRTAIQARDLYEACILQHKTAILMLALLLTLLLISFLTMSVFTRRLNQVDRALHQLIRDTDSPPRTAPGSGRSAGGADRPSVHPPSSARAGAGSRAAQK